MIFNKDFRHLIKNLNKDKTLIITDPPYNVSWKYDTYKDKVSKDDYLKLFTHFKGFRFVVIHYIEDIIKYVVPTMGIPTKVVQWVYNSNMGKQHRSIAFFNCKPDFNKAKQLPKNPTDKRVNSEVKLYDWWLINLVKNVSKEKENYSNQIPEKVIGNIIKIVADKDDIIFDPFMGSGTTPAVASKMNYKYIATDISKKAYNITKNRLKKIENNLFTI
jgi:DNA modification methylase|tara:strand:+ start:398 stop:1048 length:651 start_codon:yes stop_codon:yes gene_type:complete